MDRKEGELESFFSKGRLEALIDGIFAFAMTLLVVNLAINPPVPKAVAATELPERLAGMMPVFTSFIIAFYLLASYWTLHHRQFHFVRKVDNFLLNLNLLILVFIVLIPFTTSLSGDYDDVLIAVLLFHLNLFVIGLLFLVHWFYLNRTPHLAGEEIPVQVSRCWMTLLLVPPTIALAGVVVAFASSASPSWSMMVYLFVFPVNFIIRRFVCR